MRYRQSSLLGPVLFRAVRWPPIMLGGGVGIVVIWLTQRTPQGYDPFTASRLGAICLCVGASFLLDDPAASTVGTAPAPLSFRRGLRLAYASAIIAVTWSGIVALAAKTPRAVYGGDIAPGMSFPMGRLSLELTALLVAMLAGTLIAGRWMNQQSGGVAGGPIVLLIFAAIRTLPPRWAMLVGPGDMEWVAAGQRWVGLLIIASIALMVLCIDPGEMRLRRRFVRTG